jgi:hypothetical protein
MFGKGKKPAVPAVPWALAFLTTDYLASGAVQPDDYTLAGTDAFTESCDNQGVDAFRLMPMSSVQLEPTGPLTVAPATLPNWTLGLTDNLVAVIPNDDPSRQAAQHAFREYQTPRPAVFYAGPYVVAGTFLAIPSSGAVLFNKQRSLRPVVEAQVDCLLPGARLKGWRVPWLLLNGLLLHGFQVL